MVIHIPLKKYKLMEVIIMATKKPKLYPDCGGIKYEPLFPPEQTKKTKKSKSKQGTDKKDKGKK